MVDADGVGDVVDMSGRRAKRRSELVDRERLSQPELVAIAESDVVGAAVAMYRWWQDLVEPTSLPQEVVNVLGACEALVDLYDFGTPR